MIKLVAHDRALPAFVSPSRFALLMQLYECTHLRPILQGDTKGHWPPALERRQRHRALRGVNPLVAELSVRVIAYAKIVTGGSETIEECGTADVSRRPCLTRLQRARRETNNRSRALHH